MSRIVRAVLDTNVVLSAVLFSGGRLTPLRLIWQQKVFEPLISRASVEELLRVLQYPKFKLSPVDQEELLADYLPYCTSIVIAAKAPKTPDCRDPADIPFLELAAQGKADFLVTGDADMLSIKERTAYKIITPTEFMAALDLS
jgi:putative PIN family toxin of toxin-antitoxin system